MLLTTPQYFSPSRKILDALAPIGNVFDIGAQNLTLDHLRETVYSLKRYRQADGCNGDVIDAFTTGPVREWMQKVMMEYCEQKYGMNSALLRMQCAVSDYDLYSLPEAGVQLAVFDIGQNDAPNIWLIDLADMLPTGELLSPRRHAAFLEIGGISV